MFPSHQHRAQPVSAIDADMALDAPSISKCGLVEPPPSTMLRKVRTLTLLSYSALGYHRSLFLQLPAPVLPEHVS